MTLHALGQYLKYKWNAMSRYEIHSPFVYAFIEHVIEDKSPIPDIEAPEFGHLPHHYRELINKVIRNYEHKNLVYVEGEKKADINSYDTVVVAATDPSVWGWAATEYFPTLRNDSIFFVLDIHKSPAHTSAWNELRGHNEVRVSFDLYKLGMLFFRREFIEKQHFVLRY